MTEIFNLSLVHVTWNTCAQSNKANGSNWVLKSNSAAHLWGHVTYNRSEYANGYYADNESRVAHHEVWIW